MNQYFGETAFYRITTLLTTEGEKRRLQCHRTPVLHGSIDVYFEKVDAGVAYVLYVRLLYLFHFLRLDGRRYTRRHGRTGDSFTQTNATIFKCSNENYLNYL